MLNLGKQKVTVKQLNRVHLLYLVIRGLRSRKSTYSLLAGGPVLSALLNLCIRKGVIGHDVHSRL